jgi:hypothetical protein
MKMDRHLEEKIKIPTSSIIIMSLIAIGIWLLFYDKIPIPTLQKVMKHEGEITLHKIIRIVTNVYIA